MAQTHTHSLELDAHQLTADPLILLVPGLDNSGPRHWQTHWEAKLPDCERVNLGMWDDPHRNTWVNKINLAVHRAGRPVILVAHSLGCLAVAWWAQFEQPAQGNPVVGALLVAPPDAERERVDERIARFAPIPRQPLPFPAFLAASENDPYASLRAARGMAQDWGATFAYAGSIGHINADSRIDDWDFGLLLLGQLIREHHSRTRPDEDGGSLRRNLSRRDYVPMPWNFESLDPERARGW